MHIDHPRTTRRDPSPASRQRLLELMKRSGDSTIPALATALSLNVETVRHHVRALVEAGHAEKRGSRQTGPGRPEVLYGLTAQAESLFPRREGDLLRALAQHLKETGNEKLLESFFASYIDERRGAAHARLQGLTGAARLEEVARIMTELGFMASAEQTRGRPRLHLCHCPLRELVEVTRVPCRAEQSFIRELLGEPLTRLAYIPSGDSACSYRTRSA